MKRKYKKRKPSVRKQTERGVPSKDVRWSKLFDFMKENDFTMEDFLACVCANFARYADRTYLSKVWVGNQLYKIQIEKWGWLPYDVN